MFTRKDADRYCRPQIEKDVSRIMRLYPIRNIYYDLDEYPTIYLNGDVYDDFMRHYDVNVDIDYEKGKVIRVGCSCNRIRNERIICEHAIALMRTFTDGIESGLYKIKKPKKQTDYYISRVLDRLDSDELNEIEYADLPDRSGLIVLYPEISFSSTFSRESLIVDFKIGKRNEKAYLLKKIFDLQHAINTSSELTLGKKLSFIPTIESFAPEYRELVRFLCALPESGDYYTGLNRWDRYQYESYNAGRELTLSGKYLDEFMKVCEPLSLYFSTRDISTKNKKTYTILDGKPNIQTHIRKVDQGYEISCDDELMFAKGKNYIYTLDQTNGWIVRTKIDAKTERLLDMISEIFAYDKLFISDEDISRFTNLVYPSLEKLSYVKKENYLPEQYEKIKPTFEIYLDMPQDNMITAELYALYGEKKYNALETNKKDLSSRNIREEKKMDQFLARYFTAFDPNSFKWAIIDDEDTIYRLLTEGIEDIKTKATVFISDALKKLTVRTLDRVTVGVSVKSDLLQLQLNTDQRTLDDLADILSKYSPKKKYYRLKNGSFITIDDDSLDALNKISEDLQLSSKDIRKGEVSIPKYRALYLDQMDEDIMIDRDEYFRELIDNIDDTQNKKYDIPEGINASLRPYQVEGYYWLRRLQENGFAGLLADEMGLGKTLQVITFLASQPKKKRSLVVCPASLVYNWKSEIERFAPMLHAVIVSGSAEVRKDIISDTNDGDILITSYDSLKRDFELYENYKFATEVIDEAQFIKNATTQSAQSVKEIQSEFRIALTGTPIENRLSELWSIFDYLLPGFLYRYSYFRKHIESPVIKYQDKDTQERLQKMIAPFILRRYKKDVLKDLPDKLEEVYYAPLTGEQKELYDARVQRLKIMLAKENDSEFNKNKIAVLAELTRLRQICCSPALVYDSYRGNSEKEDLCIDLIKTAVEAGHKILLFSQFTTMLESLNKRLEEEGISYYYLHGGTDKKERANLVEKFQNDDVSVFSISLKAGGTGLNLTAADIVIHYDPWWNTAVENQATDRTHRIGQDKIVTVYKLIVKDTVEERIIALQASKADLAKEVLSMDEMGSGSFTREQLLDILD